MDGWFKRSTGGRRVAHGGGKDWEGTVGVDGRSACAPDPGPGRMGSSRGEEGSNSQRKQIGDMKAGAFRGIKIPTEEFLNAFESKRRSSFKVSGASMKTLIEEEMSKEAGTRRNAPSVIAKLMGLDALPTTRPVQKPKVSEACFRKSSPVSFKESNLSSSNCSGRPSAKDQQEFKDVFEVLEASKPGKHKTPPMPTALQKMKQRDKDIGFIRENFTNAKHCSTDERFQSSREFNDALEVLDSNKDLFLKFLQEPNTLFKKHFSDLNSNSSNAQSSRITVLKSSKPKKFEDGEIYLRSERKAEKHAGTEKNAINYSYKHGSSITTRSIMDTTDSFSPKLMKPKFVQKSGACHRPTRIVVLKPSLEKVQHADEMASLPISKESFQLGYRRHKEDRRSGSHMLESDVREWHNKSSNMELSRDKRKSSSRVSREMARTTRSSGSNCSSSMLTVTSSESSCGESLFKKQSNSNLVNPESLACSYKADDGDREFSNRSAESPVSKEARRHLSKQWMVSHRTREAEISSRGSSTLGEMLAFSNKEVPDTNLVDDAHTNGDQPWGISSRDGWKDLCPKKLAKSRSLPASSTRDRLNLSKNAGTCVSEECLMLRDVLNLSSGNSPDGNAFGQKLKFSQKNMKEGNSECWLVNTMGEENKRPTCELDINSDQQWNRYQETEKMHAFSERSVSYYDAMAADDDILASETEDGEMTSKIQRDKLLLDAVTAELTGDDKVRSTDHIIISKEMLPDHTQAGGVCSSQIRETESPVDIKTVEQTSPVSVLDVPDEDERSSPDCFERVNAGLQELRLQLKLLRLESASTCTEGSEVASDEETGGVCDAPLQNGDCLQFVTDEDDRDFSYILGILTDSGLHGVGMDMVFNACYLPESPVDPDVFENLEKVYDEPDVWSRAERKLLFDLTNSVLSELLAPSMDLHPWVQPARRAGHVLGQKVLAEEVWKLLVKRRKDLSSNPAESFLVMGWMNVGDDIDLIGRDVEKMLRNELLDELVSELMCR